MDGNDWNAGRDDDDGDTDANGWGSPENANNCDAQRDSTLAEKVGVFSLAFVFLNLNSKPLHIQPPLAVLGNMSKPLSSSESLPCTLFPLVR
jgi:hypothetical protein